MTGAWPAPDAGQAKPGQHARRAGRAGDARPCFPQLDGAGGVSTALAPIWIGRPAVCPGNRLPGLPCHDAADRHGRTPAIHGPPPMTSAPEQTFCLRSLAQSNG